MEGPRKPARSTVMRSRLSGPFVMSLGVVLVGWDALGADPARSKLVHPGTDGHLVYAAHTDRGDTIPDFSNCGYGGGGVPLPVVPAVLELGPSAGTADDRPRIQEA